jgi:hypothetical protein
VLSRPESTRLHLFDLLARPSQQGRVVCFGQFDDQHLEGAAFLVRRGVVLAQLDQCKQSEPGRFLCSGFLDCASY